MVDQFLQRFSRSQPTNSDVFAETSLQQASLQSGYGVALARVAVNRELPVGLRHVSIRGLLLASLEDPHMMICTAIYDNFLRSKALSIVYNCISMIGVMSDRNWWPNVTNAPAMDGAIFINFEKPGSLLLAKILSYCGMEGVDAVIDSIERRISESQQKKDNGAPVWWILREAALFALASMSEQLLAAKDSAPKVAIMLEQILTDDVAIGVHDYPFLYARLISSLAKFSSIMNNQVTKHFLNGAVKTVGMDVCLPVKVGACRALSQLLPDATSGIIQHHALDLFSSLVDLLKNASEETMHLVLETLLAAVKAGHEVSASIEPILSSIMLNMWASHVSDLII
ncbi:hypothetical protein ACS0TY_001781 [Phlomoides rotata]